MASNYSIKLSRSPHPDTQPDFASDKIDGPSFLFNMDAVRLGTNSATFFFPSFRTFPRCPLYIFIGARNSQQALWFYVHIRIPSSLSHTSVCFWHHFPFFHLTASTSVIKMKASPGYMDHGLTVFPK